MDKRSRQRALIEYLRREDAQERILQRIQKGRTEATVTISRAAELFDLSENRLRDWEEHGFLTPLRPTGPKGRRLYTPGELDKLAIIRELIDAGYTPSDIPPDVHTIFFSLLTAGEQHLYGEFFEQSSLHLERHEHLPVDQRINKARTELFLRYYASHVLRLSLLLISEELPDTTVCMLLPLQPRPLGLPIKVIEDLSNVGDVLIGWLGRSRSFHTLIASAPTFQYNTDYRLLPLAVMREDQLQELPEDHTVLLLDRRARPLTLDGPVVETVRRLLVSLYEDTEMVGASFGWGLRDVIEPATDFNSSANYFDLIINGMTEMIIRLGGRRDGEPRWKFSCFLLPRDVMLPLHQRSLVVRGQSALAPYKPGVTTIAPGKHSNSPSIRALQSGHIVTQSVILPEHTRDPEQSIRSAIAVPVGGEDGIVSGVLYVAADEEHAFSEGDQRVLRILARMLEELLLTYQVRHRVGRKLTDIIKKPALVDTFFEEFLTESDFSCDVEDLLRDVLLAMKDMAVSDQTPDEVGEQVISFLSLEIDHKNRLANRYGDHVVRHLIHEVGLRIKEQLRTFFKEFPSCYIYHMYADRFYILLKQVPLERARICAERIRKGAQGAYKIDMFRTYHEQPVRTDDLLEISGVTAHLGVTSYTYHKLLQILSTHPDRQAIAAVRSIIVSSLGVSLDRGRDEGGNIVISWDDTTRGFVRWEAE